MNSDLSSGTTRSDLSVNYHHHDHGQGSVMTKKDYRVASGEFLGTFFLAMLICASKNNMNPESHPFAIGFGLIALIYAFAPVSGGQFNPAVTTALVLRGKLSRFEGYYIIASQVIGAIVAAIVAWSLYGSNWNNVAFPSIADESNKGPAFVAEFIQTFALVVTVLNTATTSSQANNSYYGVAIGFVVVAGALTVGSVSGGCFNPAIACVSLLQGHAADFFTYVGAEILASIAAVLAFKAMNPSEFVGGADSPSIYADAVPPGSKALCEFVGTMLLAYTIALSGNATSGNGFIAIGAILSAMVYMGGAVSGAHFNPAVTTGVFLQSISQGGESVMTTVELAYYMLFQLFGAFAGGKLGYYVNNGQISGPMINTASGHSIGQALCTEILFTFFLVTTVLGVACCAKAAGNSYFGLAIGFAVLASASTVGDVSGCALNPAIGVALPVLMHATLGAWVYIVGPIIGSILGGYAFVYWHVDDEPEQLPRQYQGLQ